jgi:transposase
MGYIQGEGRDQASLFPVVLDDLVPADHVCRVIDAFVEMLVMSELGFEAPRQRKRDDLAMILAIC